MCLFKIIGKLFLFFFHLFPIDIIGQDHIAVRRSETRFRGSLIIFLCPRPGKFSLRDVADPFEIDSRTI